MSSNNVIHNSNGFINFTRHCPGAITQNKTEKVFGLKERNGGRDNEQVNKQVKHPGD